MRFLVLILLIAAGAIAFTAHASDKVIMEVYWGETCPHCKNQKPFLRELEARYPELSVRQYEIYNSQFNRDMYVHAAKEHGVEARGVPAVFVGGKSFFGDAPSIRTEIEDAVKDAIARLGQEEVEEVLPPTSGAETVAVLQSGEVPPREHVTPPLEISTVITVPFVGKVDMAAQPIILSTLLISFVDGFNPCSLWVLTLLLGMVLHSGSRKRVVLVGLVFLATTATIYGGFMVGIFKVLGYVAYISWIQWVVALFALVFGAVNVKDYFWFKKGFSFTIADSSKPGIYKAMRGLLNPENKGIALALATMVMAAGIALVELPCTAGFPVVWSQLVQHQEIGWVGYSLLLAGYLFVYLSIEIVIFLTAVLTLKLGRFEEKHGQVLKLVGGMIMIALGLVLLIEPELMNDIGTTALVFFLAALAAVLIMLIKRQFTGTIAGSAPSANATVGQVGSARRRPGKKASKKPTK
jgi:cytochrome c biogenesis protein CcdA/glutaredoxin